MRKHRRRTGDSKNLHHEYYIGGLFNSLNSVVRCPGIKGRASDQAGTNVLIIAMLASRRVDRRSACDSSRIPIATGSSPQVLLKREGGAGAAPDREDAFRARRRVTRAPGVPRLNCDPREDCAH